MATIERRMLNGKVRFHVKVRLKGYPDANATFERQTDAKRWARETETSLKEGKYFRLSEGLNHTLEEAINRYEATVLTYKRTCKLQKEQLCFWKKELGLMLCSTSHLR